MQWRFIWQETSAAFLLIYGISIAGTINGLTTPALEILTLALLLLVGLGWIFGTWKNPTALPLFGLPMLAYGGALIAAAVFSEDWRRSLIQIGYWSGLTLVYLMIADLSRTEAGRARLERAYLLTMIFIVGIGFFQLRNFDDGIPRPTSILGNANLFATTVMIAIFMALYWLRITQNQRTRLFLGGWLILLAFPLIFTASRAAWVSTAAGVVVYAGLTSYPYRHILQNRRIRLLGAAGILTLLVVIGMFYFFTQNLISTATHSTLETREDIWRAGGEAFLENPVFGLGPFTFSSYLMEKISIPPEAAHSHPHNLFLYVAVETGILGLLVLGWFMWKGVGKILPTWNQPSTIATCVLLTGFLLNNLFDAPFLPSMVLLYLLVWVILNPELSPQTFSFSGNRTGLATRLLAPSLLLLTLGIGIMQLPGELAAEQGINAARRQDWLAAASHFQRAADLDPHITAYEFQMAYAYGWAGIRGDNLSLVQAIYYYQRALNKDPHYAVHWANLAILEAYAGRDEQAFTDAQKAASLASSYRPIGYLPLRLSNPAFQFIPQEDDARITGEYSWYVYHVPGIETPLYPLP